MSPLQGLILCLFLATNYIRNSAMLLKRYCPSCFFIISFFTDATIAEYATLFNQNLKQTMSPPLAKFPTNFLLFHSYHHPRKSLVMNFLVYGQEPLRRKMSAKCQVAWKECSLLTTEAIENFLTNNICENVKKSMECYTRHGCPEGEPHLKSLHKSCGTMKEPMIKAEKVPPDFKGDEKMKNVHGKTKKSATKNQNQSETGKKSEKLKKKSTTKTKKSPTITKIEL